MTHQKMPTPLRHFHFLSLFALFLFTACGGDPQGVGSNTGNPVVPKQNAFAALSLVPEPPLALSAGDVSTDAQSTLTAWEAAGASGALNDASTERGEIGTFADEIAAAFAAAGITSIGETTETVSLSEVSLFDTSGPWSIEVERETTDTDFLRIYVIDTTTQLTHASAVIKTDSDGNVLQGLIVYVNPAALEEENAERLRLWSIAFDFEDSENALMAMRVEHLNDEGFFNAYHLHYQCNQTTGSCLGEYAGIETAPPERSWSTSNFRSTWASDSDELCVALTQYDLSATAAMGDAFELATTNDTDAPCTLSEPDWTDTGYSLDLLPTRIGDDGDATSLEYFIDGIDRSGWESLTPETISNWLYARSF